MIYDVIRIETRWYRVVEVLGTSAPPAGLLGASLWDVLRGLGRNGFSIRHWAETRSGGDELETVVVLERILDTVPTQPEAAASQTSNRT